MIFILTGPVHSGKTTLLKRVAQEFKRKKLVVSGFLSEAVFGGQERVGYDLFDLKEEKSIPLIRREGKKGWQRVGSYFFVPSGIEEAQSIVSRSQNSDICVVDEVGPLELSGKGFWPALKPILFPPLIPFLITVRQSILEDFLGILGETDTKVFDMREEDVYSRLIEEITIAVKVK
jgi:nucleoside-triphosphatase THEP1